MLAAQEITKSYGSSPVLRGVSLAIRPGQITVLFGPSGAGKTTLLKCLAFLETPDSGLVQMNGTQYRFPLQNGQCINPPWPELTVVFQQHFLWPHLTIRQNILLPLRERSVANLEKFSSLVDLFHMKEFVDRYPNEASLGQRQRAALARALVLDPRYVLLDEITSALDVEQIRILFTHLKELRRRGIGILLITHMLGFARGLLEPGPSDEVLFLDNGAVFESGGIELLESPKSPRLREFISAVQYSV